MARISVRTGRNSTVSASPLGWLFIGPFILVGLVAIGAFMLASMLVALVVGWVQRDKA